MEPIIITVDTQIASGQLLIFAIYIHTETDISKSLNMPAILAHTVLIFHR